MSNAPPAAGAIAQIVQIALSNDPERTDDCQHATLSAVDLVDALTVACLFSIAPAGEVEIPREHVKWSLV